MFHRLLSKESVALVQTAERLSEYVIRTLGEFVVNADQDTHAKSILVTYLASRLLQSSYKGSSSMEEISNEAERLVNAIGGKIGDA